MIAIARRLLGVLSILAGLVCLCWPAPGVWHAGIRDYGAEYQERVEYANQMAAKRGKNSGQPLIAQKLSPQGLAQYVKGKTGHSLRKVEGPAWQELFNQAMSSPRGLDLPFDAPPLDQLRHPGQTRYFELQLPGKYPVFLTLNLRPVAGLFQNSAVPWTMRYPYSGLFPWLAGIGLLVYLFLPRPRRTPGTFRYNPMRSQIGPDLLGLALCAVFLLLPIFIMLQFAENRQPLDLAGGWAVLTLIFWFMALLSAASFAVSAWYEGLGFNITPDGIRKDTLIGAKDFAFAEMLEMRRSLWRPPAWFRAVACLVIALNPGMAMPAALGAMETAPFVLIRCRGGGTLSIMTKHLLGWKELEQALLGKGLHYTPGDAAE